MAYFEAKITSINPKDRQKEEGKKITHDTIMHFQFFLFFINWRKTPLWSHIFVLRNIVKTLQI